MVLFGVTGYRAICLALSLGAVFCVLVACLGTYCLTKLWPQYESTRRAQTGLSLVTVIVVVAVLLFTTV